jgi:hypothetical protein
MAAAMIGMTGAPAAHADDGASSMDPIGFLDSAATDLTEVNDVLTQADLPVPFQFFSSLVAQFTGTALENLDEAEAAQAPLFTDADPFSGVASLIFGSLDQQFAQDSDAFLTAVEAFAADPSISAQPDILTAQFQLIGDTYSLIIPDDVARFVDLLFGLGGADTGSAATDLAGAAGADAASGGADLGAGFDLPF